MLTVFICLIFALADGSYQCKCVEKQVKVKPAITKQAPPKVSLRRTQPL